MQLHVCVLRLHVCPRVSVGDDEGNTGSELNTGGVDTFNT